MFCDRCGTQLPDNAQYCTNCGKSFAVAPSVWTPPLSVAATPGRWIGQGWDLVKADMGTYILIALIFFILSGIPFIQGPLIAGWHIFTMKKLTGRRADIGHFFKGFNFFLHALVASLIIAFFVFLGTLALIIPGLVIAAMYKFTYLFIIDKRMEFWPAMQASHAVVKKDYVGFVLFLILAFLVNVLGFCCLIVGLLVTVPVTFAAITAAYKELVGFEPRTLDM